MFIESKSRSLIKTIIWRLIATILTGGVAYYFTGEIFEASKITLVAAALSMIAYYIFERIWNKINWGKLNK